jgi:addiction module HigA family antidote
MSSNALAHAIGVPSNRISLIVAEKRGMTADTALRLSRAFHTSPEFWLNLQIAYGLRIAEREGGASVRAVRRIRQRATG